MKSKALPKQFSSQLYPQFLLSRQFLLLIDKQKLTSQQPADVYKFYALGEDFDTQAYLKDKKKDKLDEKILKEMFGDTDDEEDSD